MLIPFHVDIMSKKKSNNATKRNDRVQLSKQTANTAQKYEKLHFSLPKFSHLLNFLLYITFVFKRFRSS